MSLCRGSVDRLTLCIPTVEFLGVSETGALSVPLNAARLVAARQAPPVSFRFRPL